LSRAVGLKYFNVYGPNESHKGEMRSLVNKAFPRAREEGAIRLFRSHRPEYRDGEQVRDFVYVKDAVEMTLFFLDNPRIHGVFNIGTGRARSWNDLAAALFAALGREGTVEYVPMPDAIRAKYQYHTQADMTKLRRVGYAGECRSLEQGIAEYVREYLLPAASITDTR
jgi:ADP-L-glycero-D-manno-heptose 6-epimerase